MARLRWPLFRSILGVGAVASVTSLQTNVIIALATALVASAAGAGAAAGYGTGARLEYLLIPIIFGLGAPLVALVGTNIGAGQRERALRIAFIGGAMAFVITEAIGIAAAIWPQLWITQFSADPHVVETATSYLRVVGPTYVFCRFGLRSPRARPLPAWGRVVCGDRVRRMVSPFRAGQELSRGATRTAGTSPERSCSSMAASHREAEEKGFSLGN